MGERSTRLSELLGRASGPSSGGAAKMSRRAVLRAGTIGAAAVGAVSAFPSLLGELTSAGPEVSAGASEASAVASESEALSASAFEEPIVAHIRDARTGDMSLYVGEREIPYRDPALVHKLIRVAR